MYNIISILKTTKYLEYLVYKLYQSCIKFQVNIFKIELAFEYKSI